MTPEESIEKITELKEQLSKANQTIAFLLNRINELEKRLSKDSHNSHKPPSTDGLKKKKRKRSLRKRSGKKPGGQKGHPGHNLKAAEKPDKVIPIEVNQCGHCGQDLKEIESSSGEKRQVFELPDIRYEVIEYSSEKKTCPHCQEVTRGEFPESVKGTVQYGPRVKAAMLYLQQGQFLSHERACQSIYDLFGLSISEGTLNSSLQEGHELLGPAEQSIKLDICKSSIVQSDETGIRVEEKTKWIHSASTESETLLGLHHKRGKEGMDSLGVLNEVTGRIIHDGWKSYFDYSEVLHGLCNAHHLRELIYIKESEEAPFAQPMIDLLLSIKTKKEELIQRGYLSFVREKILEFELKYEEVLLEGYRYYSNKAPPISEKQTNRGRKKQWPGKNLLDRLKEHRASVLAFMYDFNVPFDNNLSERDLRMCKLRQKVSGEFRTQKGAQMFCRLRSVFSTAKKRGINIFDLLCETFGGVPSEQCIQPI